jgi:hypothetical protein
VTLKKVSQKINVAFLKVFLRERNYSDLRDFRCGEVDEMYL